MKKDVYEVAVGDLVVGCDPGKSGCLVLMERVRRGNNLLEVVEGIRMPESYDELSSVLYEWFQRSKILFIEQVPKFAGEDRSAAFMCVLFGNYREIFGLGQMYSKFYPEFRVVELSLLSWMNAIIPQTQRSRDRAERKKQLCEETNRRWPQWKWVQSMCDAPLIAEAGVILSR